MAAVATAAPVHADLAAALSDLVHACFGTATRLDGITPLAGDASTRRYARLCLTGPGAPDSAVAMIIPDRGIAMSSEELAVFAQPPAELPYLNVHRFLHRLGVAVPDVYADAADRGLLLLEDIGDTPLWAAVQDCPRAATRRLYEAAIEQLLLIQVEGTRRADPACVAFQQTFDKRLFLWEFEHFIEFGLERRMGRALPAAEGVVLRRHFDAIATRLDAQPRYLNHRDFHSWNLFVQGGRLRVIDFQDALLAPAAYDLATLLGDRETPHLVTPELEAALLAYYQRRWEEVGGGELGPESFVDVYYLCALQKALKVVGRFHFLDVVKGKPGYLRYIPPTVRQILRILPRFPELAPAADVLRRHVDVMSACGQ